MLGNELAKAWKGDAVTLLKLAYDCFAKGVYKFASLGLSCSAMICHCAYEFFLVHLGLPYDAHSVSSTQRDR